MGTTDTERMLQIVGGLDRFVVGVRDPALRDVGINREQWHVLRLLADGHGHSMGEICEVLDLPGATATRVIDSLAQRMLVYRRNDPLDRRRVLIFLAEPGTQTLEQADNSLLERASTLLESFAPAERASLLRLLERLATAGAGMDPGSSS